MTDLATFNISASGGDRGDWATPSSASTDIQDAFIYTGVRGTLTNVDLTALDALGYGGSNLGDLGVGSPSATIMGLTSDVPEAPAWTLMILGFAAAGAALRRRRHRRSVATKNPSVPSARGVMRVGLPTSA